jgi:hypothetical protein
MFYRPSYCCQCGEAIERIEWRLWTSRRFCELCETEHVAGEWVPRLYLIVSLIFVIFGFGNYAHRAGGGATSPARASNDAVGTEVPRRVGPAEVKPVPPENRQATPDADDVRFDADLGSASGAPPPNGTEVQRPPSRKQMATAESVYICGAETKKGTACSRRVRNGGRCWQHVGKPAMLPDKDLRVGR